MNDPVQLPVCIRKMEMRDIARVMEIDHLSFTLTWSENSYRFEMTRNKNARLWVAETLAADSRLEIIGVLGAWMIVDEVHIATLAVDPHYRKRKVANQLLDFALRQAGNEGAIISRLEVRFGNTSARKLYEKFGYQMVHIRPRYYADNGEDAVLMDMDMIQAGYTQCERPT